MAHDLLTRNLVDTPERAVELCLGRATNNTSPELSANVVFDSSTSAYALATVTLAAAPTTNFCIGEIITADSISMVVQDYAPAATTLNVYRCTSGTDTTPLGWSGVTVPGTTEAIVGSISGTSSTTTHASTVVAHVQKVATMSYLIWDVIYQTHCIRLYWAGSSTEDDIGYFNGQGHWGSAIGDWTPIDMGAAAGNTGDVLGDILCKTYRTTTDEGQTFQIEITKYAGWGQPNYEANGKLGYSTQRT